MIEACASARSPARRESRSSLRLAGHFVSYAACNALNAAVPFLLLPLLTRYLSPADFGVLAVFQAIVVLVSPMVMLAANTAVTTAFFQLGSKELGRYVTSCLVLPVAAALALTCAFAAGGRVPASYLGMPGRLVALVPVFGLVQLVPAVVLALLQATQRPWAYGAFQGLLTVSNLLLSIVFVVIMRGGITGRLLGIFLSYTAYTAVGLIYLRRQGYLPMHVSRQYVRDASAFGAPLIPHSVGGTLLGLADRFILAHQAGMSSVGVYAVAVQVASVIMLCMTAMNQAWVPFLFSKLKCLTAETPAVLVKYTYVLFACIGAVFALVELAAPAVIGRLLDARYRGAGRYLLWLGIAYCCNGMYFLVGNYFFYGKKTTILGGLTLTCAVVNIGLNLVLVPRLGAMGSAYAAALSWMVFFLITWTVAARLFPMPWRQVLYQAIGGGARRLRSEWRPR
jgi:O-antigen/teichoic acid export membrane protein